MDILFRLPLIITKWTANGGNEMAQFSKEPVLPGKTGSVRVSIHTEGLAGPFRKIFYLWSNAGGERPYYEVYLMGTVLPETNR